ncbi:hypothetical protein [Cupriavidus sp. H18C2]|uniref:hypothetical protein n=1 Tax=Cupriavidus sp. H18C2 TaxID=3241602 RepID=UPI003BF8AB28
MSQDADFDMIRVRLLSLARSRGIGDAQLQHFDPETGRFDWNIDWADNLNEIFKVNVATLQEAMKLFDLSTKKGDMLAQRAALVSGSVAAHSLKSFFEALMDDLHRASSDPAMGWPDFPDDYKIPEEYEKRD